MNRRELLKTSSLLLGYTVTGSTAIAVLNGCSADTSADWAPVNFDIDQFKLVSSIAETIIPATETPGAIDAGVDRFIDALMTAFDESEVLNYKEAILKIENISNEKFKQSYTKCNKDQRHQILDTLINGTTSDKQAFQKIRETVIVGFCISEIGANQFLNYDPIPGAPYQGCVDFNNVGKTWALADDNIKDIFIH
ncbi:MAG: gluconate 2-dehydrogenase subunit 3 family protein [Saprospiraceae bacterium]|nr:gluconate 2-dehydrogenase subunit 3 family protein [Saprospiraceae bacterium]